MMNPFHFKGLVLVLCLLPDFTASSLPNVAPSGTASQVSTREKGGVASKAIDGDSNPYFSAGSCTHTAYTGENLWWKLLLPAVYNITSVSITGRIAYPKRLDSAEIRIGNSTKDNGSDNPICAVVTSIPAGGTRTFDCGGMIGRLVRISLNHPHGVLTLCEVEVYGELAPPSPSFSAVVLGRRIVVVEKKLCWSDALFYCRDFYWDLLSIRSEEEQKEVEEVLRTTSFLLTPHVWVGLRRYLMDSIWFWMSGASVNYSYWKTHSPSQISSPCGGVDTSDPFHWTDFPCGDHLYFICLTDGQEEDKRVTFYSSTRP
ncbi:uncharacterized protein LOC117498944 [Trematomus bernacchii]|uniref:uncharacterized protein LOC117498944 n=1 Tax=Trematomus bernacchii TaxID=40690 RepID=UPI00146E109D|nr:uncharacterized protein LOC117498944 [Trematomus bernacchii]